MGQSRSRAKVNPVTIDPPSEPSQSAPSIPFSPTVSHHSSSSYPGVFESFLIHQKWGFTGLQPEDGQPQTSASNFMVLQIQHGQPNTLIFEPLNFDPSIQPCIHMIWNLPNGELTWNFTGAHWKNPDIRRRSLIFKISKDPSSATLEAMIVTLKLPTRLQDLPLKTDHLGLILNEERLVFHKEGVHWIRSTEKAVPQTSIHRQLEVEQCRKMYHTYVRQHLQELKPETVVVYDQVQSFPEIYGSKLEAERNLEHRSPIFWCTYRGCHAQEIKGRFLVDTEGNTLSIESFNTRSRLSSNSHSESVEVRNSHRSGSRSMGVVESPMSRSKSAALANSPMSRSKHKELPSRKRQPQFVL